MNVKELIERSESCRKEVALEYYNAFAGIQDNLEIVPILAKYRDLYSQEAYDYVMGLTANELPDERERSFMRMVFTQNYFTERLKEHSEKLANAEGAATVKFDDQEVPYRALPVYLSNEKDYDKRGRMEAAYFEQLIALNPMREEADRISREIVTELGHENMIAMCEDVYHMRVYGLGDLLKTWLDDTEDIYEERLSRYAGEMAGIDREKMRHADIGYLMRASRFDHLFPTDDMVPALSRTLKGLGIDLESQDNATLDLESRPKKSPRAFCIGIDAPRDVRLVLQPRGGQDDYSTFFHEAGHLEFGAHMSPDIFPFYRTHGDTSVHESYAFLLQHLVDDPVWWKEIMKADPGECPAFARFNRLYFLRRYTAKLHYEIEYYERGGGRTLMDTYAKWLSRGTGVQYPRDRYLDDFDGGFYVSQYLQAWIWEVQLRSHLKKEFGEAWFTNRKAGDFLREIWHDGMKFDVWEIAGKLGYGGLTIEPLKAELTQ